tara:strand:+ start:5183 stop:5548 length:366 start_codon:yes stop_codon:yes gene_type:complete
MWPALNFGKGETIMAVYGELKNGYLINICATKPDARSTPYEIVELVRRPDGDIGDAYTYDRDNKIAVISQEHRNGRKKREILVLMQQKKNMQEVASELGIDYTTEIAALDSQMAALAAELS